MNLVGLRAAARIARRSAMRHRKRTILILVLIALPVAAAIVVAGFVRASQDDPVRATQGTFGAASVRIDTGTPGSALDDWIADQIAGEPDADFTKYRELYTDLGWGGELLDINLGHPLARGIFFVVEGTTPSVRNQVALSSRLANRLQASVGDTVELTLGGSTTLGYTVTGLVQDPLRIRRAFAIVTPQEMDAAIARAEAQRAERDNTTVVASQVRSTWLVGGVDSRFSARVLSEWERSGTEFWPTPAVDPRPPELEFLSVETYYSLDAGAIEELVDLASTLGDEALREAAFDRVDPDRMVSFPWVDAVSRDEWVRRVATGESTLGGPPALGTLVSVLLLAEVALVAGAAYATGIRRRMREIGLLGSNGATDTHVRTIVVGEGIVAGLLGSTLGTAMAVTLLIMGRPLMQRFVDRLLTAPPVAVADVVGPAVVGVLAATVAAWAPARTASSVPTVAALHGRMPQKAPRRWIAPAGLGLVGFGMLLVIVAKVAFGQGAAIQAGLGAIFMIGGAALLTGPMISVIGGIADRFRATSRLVLRDAARQRTRASVAMSAVMVVLLAPIIVGVGAGNARAGQAIQGLPAPANHVVAIGQPGVDGNFDAGYTIPEDVEAVQAVLPESAAALITTLDARVIFQAEAIALQTISRPESLENYERDISGDYRAAVGTPSLAAALGEPRIAQALESGNAVVLGVEDRSTTLTINDVAIEATEVAIPVARWAMPRLLLPQSIVDELGLRQAETKALFVTPQPLALETANALWDLDVSVSVSPRNVLSIEQALWIGLGATFLVILGIIGLITMLSATESDGDLATMVAVGAPPWMRRRFLGLQTALFTLVAGLLAAPLGWLLMKVSADSSDGVSIGPFGTVPSDIATVPWGVIAVVVLVMPVAVGTVTALVVKSSSTMPSRQAL